MNKPIGHTSTPEPWIARFASQIPPQGRVLDLACGGGRHTRLFLERGHPVTAIDIDLSGIADLHEHSRLEALEADLEHDPWPLADRRFSGVVVTNYLWRPILPHILASLETRGVLLYDTFARGQERFGKPTNPAFLLEPGELLESVCGVLTVYAYEHGEVSLPDGRRAVRQRLYARREAS